MAHYDCSNCGAHLGVDWGSCKKCTPKEWDELKKEKSELIQQFKNQWNHDNKELLDMLEAWKKKIEEARTNFAEEQSALRRAEIDTELFNLEYEHHHSFKSECQSYILKLVMRLWNVDHQKASTWWRMPSADLCFGRTPEDFCSTKGGYDYLKKVLENKNEEIGIFG